MNNVALFTADCGTHVKIMVVALVASLAVCLVRTGVHLKPVGFEPLHRSTSGFVVAGS